MKEFDARRESITVADCRKPGIPLVYVNAGFERFSGYHRQEVLGRNCRFLQGPGTDRAEVARLHAAIDAGESCTVELLNFRKNGTSFMNRLLLRPVFDRAGKPAFYIGLQSDVSQARHLEARLVQHLESHCR